GLADLPGQVREPAWWRRRHPDRHRQRRGARRVLRQGHRQGRRAAQVVLGPADLHRQGQAVQAGARRGRSEETDRGIAVRDWLSRACGRGCQRPRRAQALIQRIPAGGAKPPGPARSTGSTGAARRPPRTGNPMFAFLNNFNVGKRLGAGFGILVALMAVLAAVAFLNMRSIQDRLVDIVDNYNVKSGHLNEMYTASTATSMSIRNLLILDDLDIIEMERESLAATRQRYDVAREALYAFPADARILEFREKIDAARAASRSANDRIEALVLAQDLAGARDALMMEAGPAARDWRTLLEEDLAFQDTETAQAYASAKADYARASTSLAVIAGVALAVAALLGWLLTRSILRPLQEATRVARDISRGRLDGEIAVHGRDEVAVLLGSMADMQAGLQRFARAQGEIASQHEAGEIDHRIAEDEFDGAFGEMAAQVNALVAAHIAVQLQVVDMVGAYA